MASASNIKGTAGPVRHRAARAAEAIRSECSEPEPQSLGFLAPVWMAPALLQWNAVATLYSGKEPSATFRPFQASAEFLSVRRHYLGHSGLQPLLSAAANVASGFFC